MNAIRQLAGRWVAARYPGRCTGCGQPYRKGTPVQSGGHWGSGRWIADCCATDATEGGSDGAA